MDHRKQELGQVTNSQTLIGRPTACVDGTSVQSDFFYCKLYFIN